MTNLHHFLRCGIGPTAILLGIITGLGTGCQSSMPTTAEPYYPGMPRQAQEVAAIKLPNTVLLTKVDNVDYGKLDKYIIRRESVAHVLPGKRVLSLQYIDFWDVGVDDYEKVTSVPKVIEVDVQAGGVYEITHREPKDLTDAQRFAGRPEFNLVPVAAGRVTPTPKAVSRPMQDPVVAQPAVISEPVVATKSAAPVSPSQMLRYWWDKSNEPQRDAFLSWMRKGGDASSTAPGGVNPLQMLQFWWVQTSEADQDAFLSWMRKR